MAIYFEQDLQEAGKLTTWLAVHADNVVRYKEYDAPNDTQYGEIVFIYEPLLDAIEATVTGLIPDNDGLITFNLQEVLLSLFSHKADDLKELSTYVGAPMMPNLFYHVKIKYRTVNISGYTFEDEREYYVTRGVQQVDPSVFGLESYTNPYDYLHNIKDYEVALHPSIHNDGGVDYVRLKVFNGYPADLQFIYEQFNSVYLDGAEAAINTIGMFSIVTAVPNIGTLPAGMHTVGISDSVVNSRFFIDTEDRCGVYMKWLNSKGGYSYWLFSEVYRVSKTTRRADNINVEVLNIADGFNFMATGYDTQMQITLYAEGLREWEKKYVSEIQQSIFVEMYLLPKGEPYILTDPIYFRPAKYWQRLIPINGQSTVVDTKKRLHNYTVTLELPIQQGHRL